MKTLNTMMMRVVILMMISSISFAEWVAQDIGIQADMQVLDYAVVDENTVWAVGGRPFDDPHYRGLSRTTDGGETWEYQVVNVDDLDLDAYIFVNVFALSDSVAWALMTTPASPHRGRMLKTVDAGDTWTHQASAYPDQPGIHNGPDFVHFFNANDGITAGDLCETYITGDGGENWNRVAAENMPSILDNEDPHNSGYCVAGDSTIFYSTNMGRVFKSTNRGATWAAYDIGFGETLTFASFQDEMTGVATAPLTGTGIAKTIDGGLTWTMLDHTLPTPAIMLHVTGTENTYMFGSGDLPLYLSSAPGSGFTSDFGASYFYQNDLSLRPALWANAQTGWCGNADNKIYKWVEEQVPTSPFWEAQDPGYPEDMTVFNHHVVNDEIIWTVGGRGFDQPAYNGYSYTTDGGTSWSFGSISGTGLDNYFMTNVFALDGNTAWITLANNISNPIQGRIYKTSDGGVSWIHQSTAYPNSSSIAGSSNFVHFFDASNGITVGDFAKTYVTSNGGDLWTPLSSDALPALLAGEEPMMSNYSVAGDSSLFYCTNKGRVFVTQDAGASWSVSDPGFGPVPVFASFRDEMNGFAVSPFMGTGIAKTVDGGMNWDMLNESQSLPYPSLLTFVKGTENHGNIYMYAAAGLPLYIEGSPYGFGFINENGESVQFENDSNELISVEGDLPILPAYFVSPNLGWASAMDNKLYKYVGPYLGPTGIDEDTFISPNTYLLAQNFPNPFNPMTTIQYAIGITSPTRLDVFNLRGAHVASLVDGIQTAGVHTVSFDASQLSSGTYIYRLTSNGQSMSRKMLLIK